MSIDSRPREIDIPVIVDGEYVYEDRPNEKKIEQPLLRLMHDPSDPVSILSERIALSAMRDNCFCLKAFEASGELTPEVLAERITDEAAILAVSEAVNVCYNTCHPESQDKPN